jgi:hypothetical protein
MHRWVSNLQLRQSFSGSVKMTNRRPKIISSIILAPALAQSEHAGAIVSMGNDLRASFALANRIPIERVKLEITLSDLKDDCFLDAGLVPKSSAGRARGVMAT